jgi:hypothetical protein
MGTFAGSKSAQGAILLAGGVRQTFQDRLLAYTPPSRQKPGTVGTVPIFGEKNWETSRLSPVYSPVIRNCPSY